jgi:hypothetical protein
VRVKKREILDGERERERYERGKAERDVPKPLIRNLQL